LKEEIAAESVACQAEGEAILRLKVRYPSLSLISAARA
jgi:hypothetical protein